ncbi:MAG: hypothetical protein U0169_17160 [Polyangiaceae bacterium]
MATTARVSVVVVVTWAVVAVFVFEFVRSPTLVAHRPEAFVALAVPLSLLFVALLVAEDARLNRELRLACDGTSTLRQMALGRRGKQPFFVRLLTTHLGSAALLLAEGDDVAAGDAIVRETPFVAFGRMERLKRVVEADLSRARKTAASRDSALELLSGIRPFENRAADVYRAFVLTRTLLEGADRDGADRTAREFGRSPHTTVRTLAVWLHVWFDLDGTDAPSDADLRIAALFARNHGAQALVEKIEAAFPVDDETAAKPSPALA